MLLCQLIHHQLVVRLPWKQAVRLRRTLRRWIVVHWAGLYHQLAVSFMAPGVGILAGAKNESVMMEHPKR